MKRIKYISAVIIIWLGLFLVGEHNVLQIISNLDRAYPHVMFDFGDDWKNAADDITTIANRNNIVVFTYDYKFTSLYILEYTVELYSSQELPQSVAKALGGGHPQSSLIRGNISITFSSFDNVAARPTSPYIYMYGEEQDKLTFIDELSGLYTKLSPVFNASYDYTYRTILLAYLSVAILFLLFLTLADVYFQKKEAFIRISLGASASKLIQTNVITDTAVYTLIFACGCFLLSFITSVFYNKLLLLLMLAVLLATNSLIYLLLYKIDHKYAVNKSKMPKRLLRLSYVIKSAAAIFAMAAISSTIMLIPPSLDYLRAQSFFSEHSDYYYANFRYKTPHLSDGDNFLEIRNRNTVMNETIYTDYFDESRPIILSKVNLLEGYIDFDMVFANINAFDYIASAIPDFSMETITSDMCILIPCKMNSEERDTAVEWAKIIMMRDSPEYSVFVYDSGARVLNIDSHSTEISFTLVKDPVILFDKTHPTENVRMISAYIRAIMYRLSDDLKTEIITRFNLEDEIAEITNVYDLYNHFWNMTRAGVFTATLVSIMALILAALTVFRIISLEYTVNAIELCIKKTLGYGIIRKNADTLVTLFLCNILCSILAISVFALIAPGNLFAIVIAIGIILCMDVIAVIWSARRVEKARITEILKGGAL